MTTTHITEWSARIDNGTLIMRNEETFDEYSRAIDAKLCEASVEKNASGAPRNHTIFTFPQAIDVIREIITHPRDRTRAQASESSGYEVAEYSASNAFITVVFTASTVVTIGSFTTTMTDSLIVDCQAVPSDPSQRAVAKMDAELKGSLKPQIADLRALIVAAIQRIMRLEKSNADLTRELAIANAMRNNAMRFGNVPAELWKFAEEVMRVELIADPPSLVAATAQVQPLSALPPQLAALVTSAAHEPASASARAPSVRPYVFPAMSNKEIWLGRERVVDIGRFMRNEAFIEIDGATATIPSIPFARELRHWNSLLWMRCVVRVFECRDPCWVRMLADVRAARIVIGASVSRALIELGSQGKCVALHPSIRSVVWAWQPMSADCAPAWIALGGILSARNACEVILPSCMSANIPGNIIIGANVKYINDTTRAEFEPLTWHIESIADCFASDVFFSESCIALIDQHP